MTTEKSTVTHNAFRNYIKMQMSINAFMAYGNINFYGRSEQSEELNAIDSNVFSFLSSLQVQLYNSDKWNKNFTCCIKSAPLLQQCVSGDLEEFVFP